MRGLSLLLTLTLAPLAQAGEIAPISTTATCAQTERYQTRVDWHTDPVKARALAKQQGKLVVEMHVSGNFERPAYT